MKSIFYSFLVTAKKSSLLFFLLAIVVCAQAKGLPGGDPGKTPGKNKMVQRASTAKLPVRSVPEKVAAEPLACPCTLFAPTDVPDPGRTNFNDDEPIVLGVKFQAEVDGFILGIRFYKGDLDITGIHTGTLFDITGTPLATATFTGETASGWQQVNFLTPVAVTAGVTYVASYYSSSGFYSFTHDVFVTALSVPPLTAVQDGGADGANGVYGYDPLETGTVFPTNAASATNYWVDAVFSQTIILPVSLVNFKAAAEKDEIVLSWQTQTEQNNSGFEIQRSIDGAEWAAIGFVKGAGESNDVKNYSYPDKHLTPDQYSYRLKQVDYDNRFKISPVVSATVGGSTVLLLANYPNPFSDNTTLQFVLPKAMKVRLSVLDVQGRTIAVLADELGQPGKHRVNFNTKGISSGVYYYKLESESQTPVLVGKMVVQ